MSYMLAINGILAAASKSKSSGSYTIFILLGLFALFYFLVIRPRSQKQRAAREQVKAAEVGDEISTIGGLVGTIVSEDGDRVTVSTGNGTELVFLRAAIGKKIEPAAPAEPTASTEEFSGPPPGFDGEADSEEPDAK